MGLVGYCPKPTPQQRLLFNDLTRRCLRWNGTGFGSASRSEDVTVAVGFQPTDLWAEASLRSDD